VTSPAYDRMGVGYTGVRRPDPRIEAAIHAALGDARVVLNIGAGAGSYEPRDRETIAVEPSPVMIAQRPPDLARAIQGVAEQLPLDDDSVDATMGVFTLHHWNDVERGLAEVLRVTRDRVAFVTLDLEVTAEMWLCRDYLPEIVEHDRRVFPTLARLDALLPNMRIEPLPVPADCADGFCIALWDRPEAHLDPDVRRASSIWHQLPGEVTARGLERLRDDLESGEWDRRHGELRRTPELDVGLRLVRAEPR